MRTKTAFLALCLASGYLVSERALGQCLGSASGVTGGYWEGYTVDCPDPPYCGATHCIGLGDGYNYDCPANGENCPN